MSENHGLKPLEDRVIIKADKEGGGLAMTWFRQLLKDYAEQVSDAAEFQGIEVLEDDAVDPVVLWIPGCPAPYATQEEEAWKKILKEMILPYDDRQMHGVSMHFYVQHLKPGGKAIDIDNLCEPVIAVLVDQLGWFKGNRSNIQWFYASKSRNNVSGLRLTLYPTTSLTFHLDNMKKLPVFQDTYTGDFPSFASDPRFVDWMEKMVAEPTIASEVALLLRFGDETLDLGDLASGRIKNLINCMYPLLGGSPGREEDWRIKTLAVDKGFPGLEPNEVSITVWDAAESLMHLDLTDSQLEKAVEVALKAHAGQKDKAGAPHILHPLRVMTSLETETEQICGVLHDVVEDTLMTLDQLRKEGFSQEVLDVLEKLTKQEEENYDDYISRVMTHPLAARVKLADLMDNMDVRRINLLGVEERERLLRKYQHAESRIRSVLF